MLKSPWHPQWQDRGAQWFSYQGWELPLHFGSGPEEHLRVRKSGGVFDNSFSGIVRLRGADAESFLNRMSTVNTESMADMQWRHGMLLDVQGKVLILFRILRLQSDHYVMLTQLGQAGAAIEHLEKYHVSEDVEIVDETGQWALLGFHGAEALQAIEDKMSGQSMDVDAQTILTLQEAAAAIYGITTKRCGEAGIEFLTDVKSADALYSLFCGDDVLQLVSPFGMDAENTLRFEAGMLNMGMELDGSINPLEAGLDDWVPRNQGCYLGQEVVERIRTHDNVPKRLKGFLVQGSELISAGTPIELQGEQVGLVVNSMYGPSLNSILAMGYIRRQALQSGEPLRVAGFQTSMIDLPFYSTPVESSSQKE